QTTLRGLDCCDQPEASCTPHCISSVGRNQGGKWPSKQKRGCNGCLGRTRNRVSRRRLAARLTVRGMSGSVPRRRALHNALVRLLGGRPHVSRRLSRLRYFGG